MPPAVKAEWGYKTFAFVRAVVLLLSVLIGCGSITAEDIANQEQAEVSGLTIRKIGVATYNVADPQGRMSILR